MGKSRCRRFQAETNRCDVFSSASSRGGAGLLVTRCADLFGESLRVRQRALHEHARPAEVARRLLQRFGFLVYREDFPHGDAMTGQIGFATGKGVAKGDSGKLGLETF